MLVTRAHGAQNHGFVVRGVIRNYYNYNGGQHDALLMRTPIVAVAPASRWWRRLCACACCCTAWLRPDDGAKRAADAEAEPLV